MLAVGVYWMFEKGVMSVKRQQITGLRGPYYRTDILDLSSVNILSLVYCHHKEELEKK